MSIPAPMTLPQTPVNPGSGLGRDLKKDEAAVTCTRDGKLRAVSLEVNFGHEKKWGSITLISW